MLVELFVMDENTKQSEAFERSQERETKIVGILGSFGRRRAD